MTNQPNFPPIYPSLSLADKLDFIMTTKWYTLEDGADAHVELHHRLIPEAIKQLRSHTAALAEARAEGKRDAFQEAFDFLIKEKVMTAKSPLAGWFRGMWEVYRDATAERAKAKGEVK